MGVMLLAKAGLANSEDGKAIFTTRCAACHNVNVKVVGPALAGVEERRSVEWITNFVHSSQALVKKNDKDAVALFNQFNNTIMPDHPDISEVQIRSILDYIKAETKTIGKDDAPFPRPGKLQPSFTPISIYNGDFFFTYIAFVLVMIASFVVAVRVKELQRENTRSND